ncbi:MAG: chorismate synthase [Oscillospiraceae bacterium]|nr:chorismate synthase [Oscillospiraceae bacterium]
MNTWGNKLKLSIFGESHGPAVGIVIDGLPPGGPLDMDAVQAEMRRRAPGRDDTATARREGDMVEILSGLHDGRTTGAPLCAIVRNHDVRSGDYDAKLRPGHADWTALLKYKGFADRRGGGHFSGRLTAPLVFAGALAGQFLSRQGVRIKARMVRVGQTEDPDLMRGEILAAKADGDSVGGIVEAVATGVPGGLGDPFFASLESVAASLLFSIPAVKGVEFGDGFALAAMRGSQANDELCVEDVVDVEGEPHVEGSVEGGRIRARTNHNGGILGGITNGEPVVVRVAIKPTPSIARPQRSVDASTMGEVEITIKGRHDPCIVPRAVPVVEAALALSLLDCCLMAGVGAGPEAGPEAGACL